MRRRRRSWFLMLVGEVHQFRGTMRDPGAGGRAEGRRAGSHPLLTGKPDSRNRSGARWRSLAGACSWAVSRGTLMTAS